MRDVVGNSFNTSEWVKFPVCKTGLWSLNLTKQHRTKKKQNCVSSLTAFIQLK